MHSLPSLYMGVRFLDRNGDGLDDLVCITKKGDVALSVNQGDRDRNDGKPPSFKGEGRIKGTETDDRERVVMADIDGDGRGDYGVIVDGGSSDFDSSYVDFWRNGWVDDRPKYWQFLGTKVKRGVRTKEHVRFEDLNGDVSC